ncbi:MAG TPA: ABC transporter substrate-binding protein [Methylomirabilota bacterium]|jgi:branched-chain amino acid transport system substrate-binding protein|nr:ABC transporter substrate-binding protein [Methylomirabilota bacterium]
MMLRVVTVLLALVLAAPFGAEAQKPIKVGFPMILSGPGALFGEPASKGAQMFVDEVNAKGGVLGRKIELLPRDTKGNADEAVRVSRELILKENVDFLVGTLTSAEGPAVSVVAKENKIVFIAPIPKTDQLTAADKLHPYIFRVASTCTIEGRTAAELVAKWGVKRVATISPDYAYGQEVTKAFVDHIKKIKPDVEIVDQQWPKLGEPDYTPFINAQLAKKPEAVFSSLWGGHFVSFAKQAKPLGYFDAIKYNFFGAGEAASPETTKSMGADYPVGIWGNSYDAFYWTEGPPAHRDYVARVSKYLKDEYPSSWAIQGYIGMQALTEAIKKAGSTDSDKVSKALLGLSIDMPHGKLTIREKDHQANRAQIYGKTVKDPKYPFAIMKPAVYVDPAKFMD